MIHKVAYVEVCAVCKQHAQIRLPDGGSSRHFANKADGRDWVIRLLGKERIKLDEARVLTEQIDALALPERQTHLADILIFIDEAHAEMESVDEPVERVLH